MRLGSYRRPSEQIRACLLPSQCRRGEDHLAVAQAGLTSGVGYAYRRLRQLDPAMRHYQQALTLNPRHRSAHEHLGEAYLVQGDLIKAQEHLAALEGICLIPCEEYDDLKRAIAEYNKIARR